MSSFQSLRRNLFLALNFVLQDAPDWKGSKGNQSRNGEGLWLAYPLSFFERQGGKLLLDVWQPHSCPDNRISHIDIKAQLGYAASSYLGF